MTPSPRYLLMNRINQATAGLTLDQLEKIAKVCEDYEKRAFKQKFRDRLAAMTYTEFSEVLKEVK